MTKINFLYFRLLELKFHLNNIKENYDQINLIIFKLNLIHSSVSQSNEKRKNIRNLINKLTEVLDFINISFWHFNKILNY
jgi:hypothetical protein